MRPIAIAELASHRLCIVLLLRLALTSSSLLSADTRLLLCLLLHVRLPRALDQLLPLVLGPLDGLVVVRSLQGALVRDTVEDAAEQGRVADDLS